MVPGLSGSTGWNSREGKLVDQVVAKVGLVDRHYLKFFDETLFERVNN